MLHALYSAGRMQQLLQRHQQHSSSGLTCETGGWLAAALMLKVTAPSVLVLVFLQQICQGVPAAETMPLTVRGMLLSSEQRVLPDHCSGASGSSRQLQGCQSAQVD